MIETHAIVEYPLTKYENFDYSPTQTLIDGYGSMLRAILLAGAASLALPGIAAASLITLDTRYSASGALGTAAAYKALIDGLAAAPATTGYGTRTLTTFSAVSNQSAFGGSNSNIAYRYTLDFGVIPTQAGSWTFRFGVDFGRGGALFLDGTPVAFRSGDLWWGGNWNNTAQLLQVTQTLSAGTHRLVLYGLEGCCDGGFQGQFRAPATSAFLTFASNDSLPVVVAEPGALAIFGAGLLGLGLLRRRSQHED